VTQREWRATTEVVGPLGDNVRLYTRDTVRPKSASLSVMTSGPDYERAAAHITYNEALRLVNGLVEYFEMSEYDVCLFPGISDAALKELDDL
jgi:hypothetical protein